MSDLVNLCRDIGDHRRGCQGREYTCGCGHDDLVDRTLTEAADKIEQQERQLAEAREDLLWNAYNTGHVKNGRWTHMFMSDGEWLARECGFDPREPDYDDAAIRAAIPAAAIRERTD